MKHPKSDSNSNVPPHMSSYGFSSAPPISSGTMNLIRLELGEMNASVMQIHTLIHSRTFESLYNMHGASILTSYRNAHNK